MAAEHYFKVAYECYKGIRPLQPKFHPTNYDMKALSPVMILLSTAQVLRSIEKIKQKYNTIAEECLKEILSGGYLTERGLLEHVHMDGSAADTPTGRIVNPGHSLETAWFLLTEGLYMGSSKVCEAAKKIIDLTLPLGLDKRYGGIIAFTDINGRPLFNWSGI